MNKIEIIPWVKFNDSGVKQEIEKLAEKSTSKMDFLSRVKISIIYHYLMLKLLQTNSLKRRYKC